MRLSDVKEERCLDVIADIFEPVLSIAQDDMCRDLFKHADIPDGADKTEYVLERVKSIVPGLIKNRKREIIDIMSAIEGTPRDEFVKRLSLPKLTIDLLELVSDREFISFLLSYVTEMESSPLPSVNTEAPEEYQAS